MGLPVNQLSGIIPESNIQWGSPIPFPTGGKLLLNNINRKMYKVIYNIYQNIKSRIVYDNAVSDFFDCNNGVRQGENLHPFLFSKSTNVTNNFFFFNFNNSKKAY
jgi:hypothetical protein